MRQVTIYTTRFCPYCLMAKAVLERNAVDFHEIPVDGNPELRQKMTERARGNYTVPQIFFDDDYIGGCDDLVMLERSGALLSRLR